MLYSFDVVRGLGERSPAQKRADNRGMNRMTARYRPRRSHKDGD